MPTPITITLIEDNASFLDTLSIAIEWDDSLNLFSKFGTAEVALRKLSQSEANPDLILLDLNLPGMSGQEALPFLKKYCPDTKILILSQSDQQQDILRAIAQGADGYLVKSNDIDGVIDNIKIAHAGGAVIDPAVASFIINKLKRTQSQHDQYDKPLSQREIEILQMLSDGKIKKEISDHFNISYNTVDSHVRRIFDKLQARNAPSAISIAHRLGLLE